MIEQDWVKAAMADDSMVVELLVRLNNHHAHASTPASKPVFPLGWRVKRQRRSKPVVLTSRKSSSATRASPTTPLSWSGNTSLSGRGEGGCGSGAVGSIFDGLEESSRPKRSYTSRSKVTETGETAIPKRSRKKKTLAELKEEEMLLLKERRHLKRELATLHLNLEKQRATNESLKRMKVDLQPQIIARGEGTYDQMHKMITAYDPVSINLQSSASYDIGVSSQLSQQSSPEVHEEVIMDTKEPIFVLPDLNFPLEDNFCS